MRSSTTAGGKKYVNRLPHCYVLMCQFLVSLLKTLWVNMWGHHLQRFSWIATMSLLSLGVYCLLGDHWQSSTPEEHLAFLLTLMHISTVYDHFGKFAALLKSSILDLSSEVSSMLVNISRCLSLVEIIEIIHSSKGTLHVNFSSQHCQYVNHGQNKPLIHMWPKKTLRIAIQMKINGIFSLEI